MGLPLETMRGIRSDQVRTLVKACEKQGWQVKYTGNTHVKLTNPENGFWITASTTTNASRAAKNLRAALRRGGLRV